MNEKKTVYEMAVNERVDVWKEFMQKVKNGSERTFINGMYVEGAFIKCGMEKKFFGKSEYNVWSVYLLTTRGKYDLYQYKERENGETMQLLLKDLIEAVREENHEAFQRVQGWLSSGPYFGADSRKKFNKTEK